MLTANCYMVAMVKWLSLEFACPTAKLKIRKNNLIQKFLILGRKRVAMVKWLSLEFVALSLRVRFPLATPLRLIWG